MLYFLSKVIYTIIVNIGKNELFRKENIWKGLPHRTQLPLVTGLNRRVDDS